ncbi:MAG: nucleoside kinase [Spirochaetaceae bacterium]|nr:nucleoside kinase [Spirochaetaceae bacterium]
MNEKVVAALYANNEMIPLCEKPAATLAAHSTTVPVYLDSAEGVKAAQRTFAYVLCMAASRVLKNRSLFIGQPLDDCYYWTYTDQTLPQEAELCLLETEMRSIIADDRVVETVYLAAQEADSYFSAQGQSALARHVRSCGKASVKVNRCADFFDIYREPLLPRTGMLSSFCLRQYHKGFVLISDISKKDIFTKPAPQILKLHDKYKEWADICGVHSVPELNAIAASGGRNVQDFIRLIEVYSEKNFSAAAQSIFEQHDKTRVILLAGPSSSGKTTSAKRLCLHLQVLGLSPIVVSLDDYYLHPDNVPRDEDGKPDFECLEALDIPYLNKQLIALLSGETVTLPKFDFKTGLRTSGKEIRLSPRSALILEGIHALNDALTPGVPREKKYKLYVSALTQIKLDEHHRISAADNRLIRRIVRDNQFRAIPASRTLSMWPSVRRGELRHIFPFQNTADTIINSALEYELGVLRIYAEPLLRSVPVGEPVHAEAARLLNLLENFAAISPQYISGISILREFIGNSEFKY